MKNLLGTVIGLVLCIACVAQATADTVFTDTFDGGLVNWTPGIKLNNEGKTSQVEVYGEDKEVVFIQNYEYIESKAFFEDDFEISFDVRRTQGSSGRFDFIVEAVEDSDFSGYVRLRYDDTYMINIGRAPSPLNDSDYGIDIDDETGYKTTMPTSGSPYMGTVTFTYTKGTVKMAFTHDTLGMIETPWVNTGASITTTKIRIWGQGSGDTLGTRFLDNVTIDAPVAIEGGNGLLVDPAGNLFVGSGGGTPLHVVGNISCSGSVDQGSSRELKRDISVLSTEEALGVLRDLQPVKYYYKADPTADQHVGFIAEEVPSLLATPDRKALSPMDIIGILTKVVQKQQLEIEQLKSQIK